MSPGPDVSSLRRRLELGRLVIGSLVELGIKAYGAGAALSVAVSDAETVGGKGQDAVAAVPNLVDRYRAAEYVVEHRQEIQAALDYVNENTPPQAELEDAAARSSETLRDIETTSDAVDAALGSFDGLNPLNALDRSREALGHVRAAWGAKPDIDSLRDLADRAEQVSPYVDQVEVLVPVYYGGLFAVVDNFASDEIASTLFVMAAALGVAFVLGQAVGFWVRRGRPGLVARTLQRWGAQSFPRWYVRNLPYALSPPLYAAARERMQRDIVADPQEALDPETLRELEQWFADRPKDDAARVDRRALSVRRCMLAGMARFEDEDLTDAEFRECDLSRTRLVGVVMQDAVIDGLVTNLVVNGVEVTAYVEAELDRRHPVRTLLRSADPADLREAQRQLRTGWAATVARLRGMDEGMEHRSVGGEWSAVKTLRHLVFVHDSWFRRCCLGSTQPFTAIGLATDFVPDQEEQGLDPAVAPALDEVLVVREEQAAELERWLASVTAAELSALAPVPEGPGWPPYAAGRTVLQCLHVVLNEEWAHHGFCVRDLDLLEG